MIKKLKRYLVAGSMLLLSIVPALRAGACGSEQTSPYGYSPFAVIEPIKTSYEGGSAKAQDETCSFWIGYTEGNVPRNEIVEYFEETDFDSFGQLSDNKFAVWLASHADPTALDYIRDCMEFNKLSSSYMNSSWDYEERDPAELREFADRVRKRKTNKTFSPRYALLAMRVAGLLRDDATVMKIWNSTGKKMKPSALRDRMGGFVGGVLYRQGNYPEALDYFYASGDDNSVAWCVSKIAGADNLALLYEHAPNSKATLYALQDYVNYLIAATNAGHHMTVADDTYWSEEDLKVFNDAVAQREGFISLCDRVLAENRCEYPMAWALAKGVLQCIGGDSVGGAGTLENAKNLNGTDKMRDTRKRFELWTLLKRSGRGDRDVDEMFVRALSKLYSEASAEIKQYNSTERCSYDDCLEDNKPVTETYDFLTTFLAREAITHFKEVAQHARALAVMALMDDLPVSPGYNNEYMQELRMDIFRNLTEQQALSFINLIEGNAEGPIDQYLKSFAAKYSNHAYEAFGTRLLCQCRFEEALRYLEKVETKWLPYMAIYPFLNRYYGNMDYYKFGRTYIDDGVWSPYRPCNIKAEYCMKMIRNMKEYDTLSGDQKAAKALEIAAMFHCASPQGDCWAITDYSWSVSNPVNDFNKHSGAWLMKALKDAVGRNTRCKIYYAVLSSPCTTDDGDAAFAIGISGRYDDKKQYYWDNRNALYTEAMNYLTANRDIVNDDYTMRSCDVLSDYAAGRFISKPSYAW